MRKIPKDKAFSECWLAMTATLSIQNLTACTYCGVVCDSVDHVPAKRVRGQLIAMGLQNKYQFVEVPCCRECNCALNTRGFTIPARRELVRLWLQHHYQDILRIPNWTNDELAKLAPSLRNYIIQGVVLREWVLERLAYTRRAKEENTP